MFITIILALVMLNSCTWEKTEPQAQKNQIYTVDDLMNEDFVYKVGDKVSVEGLCVHVCSHSGKKMFISGATPDNRLQIFTGDNIPSFDKKYEGSKVIVTGLLEEEKIDMAYINEWLAEIEKESSESTESCEFEESMKKVELLKAQVEKSKKGYVSKYTMTGIEVKEI